jgi:hypothetical protein
MEMSAVSKARGERLHMEIASDKTSEMKWSKSRRDVPHIHFEVIECDHSVE